MESEPGGCQQASDSFEVGLLLVEIIEGMPLLLKAHVATDGEQEGVFGILAGVAGAVGEGDSLRWLYPTVSGRHESAELLAGGEFGEVAVLVKMVMGLGAVATAALCAFFDEQVDEHLVGGEFEQGWYGHGFLSFRKGTLEES